MEWEKRSGHLVDLAARNKKRKPVVAAISAGATKNKAADIGKTIRVARIPQQLGYVIVHRHH